jgi:serine/threonine protein kinase
LLAALGLITDLSGPPFDIWFLQLFVQIIVVLGLLECAGINHRDMKGDNILINTVNRQVSKSVILDGRRFTFNFMNLLFKSKLFFILKILFCNFLIIINFI